MAYIKINRNLRQSDFYRKSSAAQREVLWEIIHRVQYCTREVSFGGSVMNLEIGDLYISRPKLVEALAWAKVSDSHVRNVMLKLERGGYVKLIASSKINGSVYRCFSRFFDEIAMPFSIAKSTNHKPTINQPLTNHKPTINQRNVSDSNTLGYGQTNDKPTINQPLTNDKPTINHILINNKEEIINNKEINDDSIDFYKNDFEPFLEKVDVKSDLEIQIKKVAQKKESAAFEFSDVQEEDTLRPYFENPANIEYWGKRFPLLNIGSEFEGIYEALMKKAADGLPQLNNPYSYILKCLENAEKKRQQRVVAQKNGKAKAKMSIVSSTQINPDKYRAAALALQKKAK